LNVARFVAVVAAGLLSAPALAQPGRVVPGPMYQAAIEELYSGDPRGAARSFQGELRGAIRTVEARWTDSICYFAMLGDALEQQGQHAAALQQYTLAVELFLADPQWLQRLQFQQGPRPDLTLRQRLPAWAVSRRNPSYAEVPRSFLAAVGQLDNRAAAQQGGVVRQAQFWKLDAQEVSRTVGLAIYRRARLLGPLAPTDPLQKRVMDTIARGGLGVGSHWSSAWVELWWGLAAAGLNDAAAAAPHLERATLLDGRWDHALTGMALAARARMALQSGDAVAAQELATEALTAAIAYNDFAVMADAIAVTRASSALTGATPPWFELLGQLTTRSGLHLVAIDARLGLVEGAIRSGQPVIAADLLSTLFARARLAEAGPLGIDAARLRAVLAAADPSRGDAAALATRAVALQRSASLRNFRVALANARLDEGALSPRSAAIVYPALLDEPGPIDWAVDPLDCHASLVTDHTDAIDRWFATLVARRETKALAGLVDLERRRRFLGSQRALAVRSVGVRRLLEASSEALGDDDRAQRAALLERFPAYAAALRKGGQARAALRTTQGLFDPSTPDAADEPIAALLQSAVDRERLLALAAMSRGPTPLTYPPRLDVASARDRLGDGETLCVFHETRGELQGIVLTKEGEHAWPVGDATEARAVVVELLGAVAGVSPQQKWTPDTLAGAEWRDPATRLSEMLFRDSRIDFAATKMLTIVPDGVLWHCPWGALLVGSAAGEKQPLSDVALLRVSPTPGAALRLRGPLRPTALSGIVATNTPDTAEAEGPPDPLTAAVPELKRLPDVLPGLVPRATLDTLVVDTEVEFSPTNPYGVSLLPKARKQPSDLFEWQQVPHPSPQVVVLTRSTTIAEKQLKGARRGGSRGAAKPGDELFHATCAMLASGVDSILLSRWDTQGARSRELAAEYLIGVADMPPTEAWRRSVRLARSQPLEATREPRLDAPDDGGAPPDASHPFFWAGYLLVQ
jgi:tetratricopeptide (TPR) repeat protein